MLEIALQLVICAAVFAVIFFLLQAALVPRYVFVVQINGPSLNVTKGKVRGDFLDDLREVLREFGVTSGWIGGVKRGKSIALRFSGNIPQPCQQRLRNLWFTS
jgi:Protein of unknown function (DUF3634)